MQMLVMTGQVGKKSCAKYREEERQLRVVPGKVRLIYVYRDSPGGYYCVRVSPVRRMFWVSRSTNWRDKMDIFC